MQVTPNPANILPAMTFIACDTLSLGPARSGPKLRERNCSKVPRQVRRASTVPSDKGHRWKDIGSAGLKKHGINSNVKKYSRYKEAVFRANTELPLLHFTIIRKDFLT